MTAGGQLSASSCASQPAHCRSQPTSSDRRPGAASGGGASFYLGGDVVDMSETPEGGPSEGIGVSAAAIVLLISDHTSQAMTGPARAHMRPGFITTA